MKGLASTEILVSQSLDKDLKKIGEKVLNKERLSFDEGVTLFEKGSLSYVGTLANRVREQLHGNK
ncbi:MAG: aminofutalosine synthase MqnE, partial [Segetibacter sp.]|nr:aminofutalosine synthase MqnE [Segetibacter sp.]